MTESAPQTPAAMFDLTDRVAIVTGASTGLGNRFARVLHEAGAHVIAVARRIELLQALADKHERITAYQADVTDDAAMRGLVDDVLAKFGRIDVLVNNAGLGNPQRAVDEDLDSFRYTVEVNLTGVFNLARLVARPMLEAGRGSIINIASVYGFGSAWPIHNGAYAASKGAVIQLTRELGCHWASAGVRVNALAPGFFESEATAEMTANPKSIEYVVKGTPMRRWGQAHELDGALVFMASDASSYLTGQTVVVDGGWTSH